MENFSETVIHALTHTHTLYRTSEPNEAQPPWLNLIGWCFM